MVFQVIPENAILQVDSTVALVRNGLAQFHLPLGKHGYHVEAPFYEELSDTVEVVDSAKIVVPVVLQSAYSYLTVKLPVLEGHIYVDGQPIGKGEATSGRLQPGDHQVLVTQNETCYVDTVVNLGIGEKRVLTLQASDLWVRPLMARAVTPGVLKEAADSTVTDSTAMAANVPLDSLKAQVTITAPDEETQIWLNREPLAYGKWEGKLALGFYIVSTLKEGLESKPIFLYVDDTLPKVLDMSLPKASYGVLNIHSNVVGATIILNQDVRDSRSMKNSTLAHEGTHHFLGRFFFALQKTHGHAYCSYMCKRSSNSARQDRTSPMERMEIQANTFPRYLMIPEKHGKALSHILA